ncbi:MAG TPA: DUF4105 domain-containing protein [Bacteriovoracaceae bacterium]|nr:DUF4105 domain-containing protein [Bacteriovoracaceae bacterium]
MLKVLCWALICLAATTHAASVSYSKEATVYLQQKVSEALNVLPVNYLDGVKHDIEIGVAALDGDLFLNENLCHLDESVHFAMTTRKRNQHKITISSRLIQLAMEVKKEFPCLHGTYEKVLIGAIIHEMTHVKDNFEKISLEPDFQRIVGVKRITKSSKKKVINQNAATSPDAYEFENLEEALAVNVEYLVLDPEFECRKPATANFLLRRLGMKSQGKCTKNYQVVTQSSYLEDNYLHTYSIDPSRVYQIHYLFAGKGDAMMSRWGHAMFRVVVCAPHRKVAGPDCMRDVSHHLALSYRAYITDTSISYAKGMFGKYPSQLFIMRFHEVQQEYTKFELRELYSIPLKMNVEQKREFIDLTLERFWTYQGKYYFLTNNCGTETQKHLAVALSEEQSDLIHSITPSKMYKDITKKVNDLTDVSIEGVERKELISKGLLLESILGELEKTFEELKEAGFYSERNLKKFLKKTTAAKRLEAYTEAFSSNSFDKKTSQHLLLRIMYLERYLLSRFVMEVPKKAVLKMNKDSALKAEVIKMGQSLKTLGLQPWQVVVSRFGVPTESEFASQYAGFAQKRKIEMRASTEEQLKNLHSILGKRYFLDELAEMENFHQIKKFTSQLFIKLNKPQEVL